MSYTGIVQYPDPSYSNVRRWPRYKLDLPVRVIAEKDDKTIIVQGRGNELNQGGLAIFAGVELRENDVCAVEFTPPYSGCPVRVRCTVRNRSGYNYGVEFLIEDEDDAENAAEIASLLKAFATGRM